MHFGENYIHLPKGKRFVFYLLGEFADIFYILTILACLISAITTQMVQYVSKVKGDLLVLLLLFLILIFFYCFAFFFLFFIFLPSSSLTPATTLRTAFTATPNYAIHVGRFEDLAILVILFLRKLGATFCKYTTDQQFRSQCFSMIPSNQRLPTNFSLVLFQ